MKNSTRSVSPINPVAAENMGDKCDRQSQGNHTMNQYLCVASEKNGGQKYVHDVCTL